MSLNWKDIDNNQIPIDGTEWTVSGYSFAADRTFIYINGLNWMFDAGLKILKNPSVIFVSHGHLDHVNDLSKYLVTSGEGTQPITKIVFPNGSKKLLTNFINGMSELTKHGSGSAFKWQGIPAIIDETREANFLPNYMTNGNKTFKIELFKCTHSIPTTGYGIIEIKKTLKPKFEKYPEELLCEISDDKLYEITENYHMCYLGDTDHHIFSNERISKYKTIMVECTFIDVSDITLAKKNKHMHWTNLKKYIEDHPDNNFVLYHFSKRYMPRDILIFFQKENLKNIKLLIQDPHVSAIHHVSDFFHTTRYEEYIPKLIKELKKCNVDFTSSYLQMIEQGIPEYNNNKIALCDETLDPTDNRVEECCEEPVSIDYISLTHEEILNLPRCERRYANKLIHKFAKKNIKQLKKKDQEDNKQENQEDNKQENQEDNKQENQEDNKQKNQEDNKQKNQEDNKQENQEDQEDNKQEELENNYKKLNDIQSKMKYTSLEYKNHINETCTFIIEKYKFTDNVAIKLVAMKIINATNSVEELHASRNDDSLINKMYDDQIKYIFERKKTKELIKKPKQNNKLQNNKSQGNKSQGNKSQSGKRRTNEDFK